MRAWWESLAEREQRLVMVTGFFVVIGLIYWVLWYPSAHLRATAAEQKARASQMLISMQQDGERIARARSGGTRSQGGSLQVIVNQSARQAGITISRMQPQGEALQVWVDEVPWHDLTAWLASMRKQHGLAVTSVDLQRGERSGTVKVRRLELTRG